MGNNIGAAVRIQAENPRAAALFYVEQLGFEVTDISPGVLSLYGQHLNLFIEQGPPLGPVIEITVHDVASTKKRLLANGCELLKEQPDTQRTYLRDPFGLVYNLTAST